jgi:hypothetical protein
MNGKASFTTAIDGTTAIVDATAAYIPYQVISSPRRSKMILAPDMAKVFPDQIIKKTFKLTNDYRIII